MTNATFNNWLECEEFYNLMQNYRNAPLADQAATVTAYEAVKAWVLKTSADWNAKIVGSVEVLADGPQAGAEMEVLRYAAKLVREQRFDGPVPGEPGSHWPTPTT